MNADVIALVVVGVYLHRVGDLLSGVRERDSSRAGENASDVVLYVYANCTVESVLVLCGL